MCVQLDLIVINCHNELCPVVNMKRTVLIEIVKRREREGERGKEREEKEGEMREGGRIREGERRGREKEGGRERERE